MQGDQLLNHGNKKTPRYSHGKTIFSLRGIEYHCPQALSPHGCGGGGALSSGILGWTLESKEGGGALSGIQEWTLESKGGGFIRDLGMDS